MRIDYSFNASEKQHEFVFFSATETKCVALFVKEDNEHLTLKDFLSACEKYQKF